MKYTFEIGQIYIAENGHEMEVVKLSPTGAYLVYHWNSKKLADGKGLQMLHVTTEGRNTGGNNLWDIKRIKKDPREIIAYTFENELTDLENGSYARLYQTADAVRAAKDRHVEVIKFKLVEIVDE